MDGIIKWRSRPKSNLILAMGILGVGVIRHGPHQAFWNWLQGWGQRATRFSHSCRLTPRIFYDAINLMKYLDYGDWICRF